MTHHTMLLLHRCQHFRQPNSTKAVDQLTAYYKARVQESPCVGGSLPFSVHFLA